MEPLMSNSRLTAKPPKPLAAAISAGRQVVAHKSTGGTLTSIPEPVDPVGNASHRLTNNTVALPGQRLSKNCFQLESPMHGIR